MESIPDEIVRHILQYLSFDEVSKARLASKRFNTLGGQILNDGFRRVRSFHSQCLREVKEELPRRESERRKHRLYPRHDVLQAVETRLSLLCMTYSRLIGDGQICFIPGKVLDELFRILRLVQDHEAPLQNSVPLLQEMRDISSMAMEHFEEEIQPRVDTTAVLFRKAISFKTPDFQPFPSTPPSGFLPTDAEEQPSTPTSSRRASRTSQKSPASSWRIYDKISSQNRVIFRLRSKIKRLENLTTSLSLTVTEQTGQISEIVKQVGVLQGMLGVQHMLPISPDLRAGASGDMNNNETVNIVPGEVNLPEKRTSSSRDDPTAGIIKRRRKL